MPNKAPHVSVLLTALLLPWTTTLQAQPPRSERAERPAQPGPQLSPEAAPSASEPLGSPIFFEEADDGTFLVRGASLGIVVGPDGLTFVALEVEETEETRQLAEQRALRPSQRNMRLYRELQKRPQKRIPHVVSMGLRGARPGARVRGEGLLPGLSHHLLGSDPSKWRRNIPQYARVVVDDVYPGVAMHVRAGENGNVEYDFHVAPGVDPSVIDLEIDGAEGASVDARGDLVLSTRGGKIRHRRPQSFEEIPGRNPLAVANDFKLRGPNRFGFDVRGRDRARKLIIDPEIVYEQTFPNLVTPGIAVDPSGSAYIFGEDLTTTKFPKAVVKLSPDGSTVEYHTLYGPDISHEEVESWFVGRIKVDAAGHAFIVGRAQIFLENSHGRIPLVNPPFGETGPTENGSYGFVAALKPDGSLLYSGFTPGFRPGWMGPLDGSGGLHLFTPQDDYPYESVAWDVVALDAIVTPRVLPLPGHGVWPPLITIDPAGNLYSTNSDTVLVPPPPLVNNWQDKMMGESDIYVTRFNGAMEITFATFFGGDETQSSHSNASEWATSLETDAEGNLYMFGSFTKPDVPFPLTIPSPPGASPWFLAKFSPTGALLWSRTIGLWEAWGNNQAQNFIEHGFWGEFAVDEQGNSYIVGDRGFYADVGTNDDNTVVLFKIDPKGNLVAEVEFPDNAEPYAGDIAVSKNGDVYITRYRRKEAAGNPFTGVIRIDGDSITTVDPSCRKCPNESNPVNVMTGNVWLDQTDVAVPGVGAPLVIRRSYNTQGARAGRASVFGLGWTAPYQQNVSLDYGRLTLEQGDGVPIYFRDLDASGIFRATMPVTETSWFTVADGRYERHFREGAKEIYDEQTGSLLEIQPAAGGPTIVQRFETGVTISDSGGRSLTLELNPAGRATSLSGPDGEIASYSYNGSDHLSEVEYVDGTGYRFSYDNTGLLLSVADRVTGDILESHTYDDQGRGITSAVGQGQGIGPTGVQERFVFSYIPGLTTVTDQRERSTTYDWTEIAGTKHTTLRTGPCTTCAAPGSETEEWSYYPDGRVETYKNGADETTTYTYYENGDLESETDTVPGPTPGTTTTRTVQYAYDYDPVTGRTVEQTRQAPDQGTTTWTYELAGPSSIAEWVSSTEERETNFTYNGTKVGTITDPNQKTTQYRYTPEGDLEEVEDPEKNITRFGYDNMGRRTSVTDPEGNKTITRYDPVGRVREIETPSGITQFEYDSQGRRTKVIDPRKQETLYDYDRYGRLKSVIDPELGATRYGYDNMSNLTSLTDARKRTTEFFYDDFNRVHRTVYPEGDDPAENDEEIFTYDGAGRLKTKTDRNRDTTTYAYDVAGRLEGKTYTHATPAVSFGYDDADRMTSASNGSDTLEWDYDLAGQVEEERSDGTTVSYTYYHDGSRETLSLDGILFLTYGYDDAGRLTTITRGPGDVFQFHYDTASRREWMQYPNRVRTTYLYDTSSRLETIRANRDDGTGTLVTSFDYDYDAAGNRTSKTTLDYTESYDYDDLYRLTGVTRMGAGANAWVYGYDAVGNRTSYQVGTDVVTPQYNDRNQLTSTVAGGQLVVRGTLDEPGTSLVNGEPARMLAGNVFEATIDATPDTTEFTTKATDDTGNATAVQKYQTTVTGTDVAYEYDPNGNLIQKTENGEVWRYEWNAENQLTRVARDATEVASFKYDPLGRRLEKSASGVTYSYAYDRADIIQTMISDGATIATNRFIHGPRNDEVLVREDVVTGTRTFYNADGLGSVVKMTDQAGGVVHNYQYDAWGNIEVGSNQAGHAFTGREWDPEIGLYYYRARYYDPVVGRFTAEDPVGFAAGVNSYSYTDASPTSWVDPDGLDAIYVDYVGYPITIPGRSTSLPLGHAGVVAVDETSGTTKYFEYGRYDSDFGEVKWRTPIPDLVIGKNGKPTKDSLTKLYDFLSKKYGKGRPVDATYYDDADFQKVIDFIRQRMNDPNRDPYSWNPLSPNHCKSFAEEAVSAGRPPWWQRLLN